MRKLHISPDLLLPPEAVTSTFVVYGGKGMGKTNFGSVLAEELSHSRLRYAVIDPMGVWWGLRYSADGQSPGVELLVLGGVKGDLPIEPTGGAVVADLVADESVNVLIDISRHANGKMWSIGERVRFVHDYFVQLYARQGEKRQPLMQILDEAARFCPQMIRSGDVDAAKCLGAVAVMVEEGRNVGVGMCLLTQRSARLNKDVAELADCMIAFRIVGPRSVEAVMDWFGEHIPKDRWKDLIGALRTLPIGRALVVSPGWLEFEAEAQIRPRETFDSSATPKPGEKVKTPKCQAAKPDLEKYQARMASTIERAAANDPRKLRDQIARLKHDLEKSNTLIKPAATVKEKRVEVPMLKPDERKALLRLEKTLCDFEFQQIQDALGVVRKYIVNPQLPSISDVRGIFANTEPRPVSTSLAVAKRVGAAEGPARDGHKPLMRNRQAEMPSPTGSTASDTFSKVAPRHQAIINAIGFYNEIGVKQCDKKQIAGFVTRPFNGNFRSDLAVLKTALLIDYPNPGAVVLTATGKASITTLPNVRTQSDLHKLWMDKLAPRHADILRVLLAAGQDASVDKTDLANAVSREFNGNFRSDLSVLRTLGTIEYPSPGTACASDNLYPPIPA